MFDAIVFDLDGTLLNTIQDLANAANYVCRQNGWPQYTVDQYKYFVGNGIPKLVERFSLPEARTPERLAHTLDQLSRRYAAHKAGRHRPYPGIPEALEQLRQAGWCWGC
ncbi:MAG: HAD hydrolase-like protein [Oscillospiraceae bacterium]